MLIIIIFCALMYFIPALIGRNKRSASGIFLLNLFLGWTFVGWIVALVWACSADAPPPYIIHQTQQPVVTATKVDQLERLAKMHKEGVLTEAEFNIEKAKLLS